jgi:hypothetical protein
MPTRLLREGILTSERVDQLDAPAEVFYRRLMSKVDDHGLYDARPSILRASLYPLRLDRVREADITRSIAACVKAGVIVLYEAGGKPYLKMLDTRWIARSEAKYPLPPENICAQPLTVVPVDVDVSEGEGGARKRARASPKTPLPEGFAVSDRVRAWAAEKGIHNIDAHLEPFVSKCRAKSYTYADWDEGFMGAVRDDWARLGKGADPTKPRRVAL